jgi:hypothetical protein
MRKYLFILSFLAFHPVYGLCQNPIKYDGWRSVPIRSEPEYNLGEIGGNNVYLATEDGLFVRFDKGASFSKPGDLPAGGLYLCRLRTEDFIFGKKILLIK